MQELADRHIYYTFILSNQEFFLPREIIAKIIMSNYPKFKIYCGNSCSFLIIGDSTYAWGNNSDGQLGLGHHKDQSVPQKLGLLGIKKIVCGFNFTFALTKTGEIYSWGSNALHLLGLKDNVLNENFPRRIHLDRIKDVITDNDNTFVLTFSGDLYSWGSNRHGTLGLGHKINMYTPQRVNLPNIKKCVFKNHRVFVLTFSGDLYSWGSNLAGPLGLEGNFDYQNFPQKINLSEIHDIKVGNHHTISLSNTGEVCTWGSNLYQQLGFKSNNINQNYPQKLELKGVTKIHCEDYSTFITVSDELYVCGSSALNELLGCGADKNYLEKVNLIGFRKICYSRDERIVLTKSGEVYVWKPLHKSNGNSPQKLSIAGVVDIKCGNVHTMIITKSNEIYTWGYNMTGQLGLGHFEAMDSPQKLLF